MSSGGQETFDRLRKTFPEFIFRGFQYDFKGETLSAVFHFSVTGLTDFRPGFRLAPFKQGHGFSTAALENYLFHIGLIEMISYWKATCSPRVVIEAGSLDTWQKEWWKDVFYKGMGEFLYVNGINIGKDEMMNITVSSSQVHERFDFTVNDQVLVPVGGGKDSAVTLEVLKKSGINVMPFMLNPRPAMTRTIETAGFSAGTPVIHRSLDTKLLELNEKGYLNGHTPFSALLAFYASLTAFSSGIGKIALSNESSANEATVPGTDINHQYSKSFEFEEQFRIYSRKHLSESLDYFSFLRPLSELQIALIFSKLKKYHGVFRSCNVGSKTDSWCGKCPKCLFTDIILAPFLSDHERNKIFGKVILNDESLVPVLDELTGMSEIKPFECVGTIDEVRLSLKKYAEGKDPEDLPFLTKYFTGNFSTGYPEWDSAVNQLDGHHHVPEAFYQILLNELKK